MKRCYELGIRGQPLDLIGDYFKDRTHCVKVGQTYSDFKTNGQGVPQGSSLGPLMFNIFINNILEGCGDDVHRICFADDLTIIVASDTVDDLFANIRSQMDFIFEWCDCNGSNINTNKSKIMIVDNSRNSRDNTVYHNLFTQYLHHYNIEMTDHVDILGTSFNSNLNFDIHVHNIIHTVSPLIGFIYKRSNNFDNIVKKKIYISLIMAKINYAIRVWYPRINKNSIKIIKRINKRAIKLMAHRGNCNIQSIKNYNNIWDVSQYYLYYTNVHTRKQIDNCNQNYCDLLSNRNSSYYRFIIPRHKTTFFEKSPIYDAIYNYNALPKRLRIKKMNMNRYKLILKTFINSKAFFASALR